MVKYQGSVSVNKKTDSQTEIALLFHVITISFLFRLMKKWSVESGFLTNKGVKAFI